MNKLLGSSLMVAGILIGGGMVALPMTTHALGLAGGLAAMALIWALMYFTALVTLEINVKMNCGERGLSLAFIGRRLYGPWAARLMAAVLGLMSLALLTAYIMGGGSLLHSALHLPVQASLLVFTVLMGIPVCLHLRWLDYANRALFFLMIATFGAMTWILVRSVDVAWLLNRPQPDATSLILGLPVIFTSFGFHGSIPSFIGYCAGDTRTVRRAFLFGSLITLAVYVTWLALCLGNIPAQGEGSFASIPEGDVGALIELLGSRANTRTLGAFSATFSFLAIATSFIGVGLGLLDLIKESLSHLNTISNERSRVLVHGSGCVLTFIPPLAIALINPDLFLWALRYAGIFLCVLAVVAPIFFVIKVRAQEKGAAYTAPGGIVVLILALVLGIAILII